LRTLVGFVFFDTGFFQTAFLDDMLLDDGASPS
jgi:hypothetical protein